MGYGQETVTLAYALLASDRNRHRFDQSRNLFNLVTANTIHYWTQQPWGSGQVYITE
jgi:hypothetical protein